jgi:uncharacterized membrane protein
MDATSAKELERVIRRNKIKIAHNEKLKTIDKIALWVTNRVGSMGFFFVIFCWTIIWLSWNMFAPPALRFDPYPAFVFWLFLSNMIQIFLMPLIMIGQNLQSKYAEARAEADFEVNTKAELEIEKILNHLQKQNQMILEVLEILKEKSENVSSKHK